MWSEFALSESIEQSLNRSCSRECIPMLQTGKRWHVVSPLRAAMTCHSTCRSVLGKSECDSGHSREKETERKEKRERESSRK